MMAPFYGGAAIAATAVLLTIVMLSESLPVEKRAFHQDRGRQNLDWGQLFANPLLFRILAIGFIGTLCFAAISPTFALYADRVLFADIADRTVISRHVGVMFTIMGLTAAVTQGVLIKPLVKRLGERRLVTVGHLALLLASLCIPQTDNPQLFTVCLLPFVFGYGLTDPALQTMLTRHAPPGSSGRLLGNYQSALSLAYILGPIWAGLVFERIAPQAVWWGTAVLLLPALLLSLTLGKFSIDVVPLKIDGTSATQRPNR
jgi:DHA1 family tetracycline resistance protein-like MFS transporter